MWRLWGGEEAFIAEDLKEGSRARPHRMSYTRLGNEAHRLGSGCGEVLLGSDLSRLPSLLLARGLRVQPSPIPAWEILSTQHEGPPGRS